MNTTHVGWTERYDAIVAVLIDRLEELGDRMLADRLRQASINASGRTIRDSGFCYIVWDVDGIVATWASSRIDPTALELMRMMTSACDRLRTSISADSRSCSEYLERRLQHLQSGHVDER